MHTFIIPCRYNGAIFECVKSIKAHYPNDAEIIVVDSDSPDKSYFKKLEQMGVTIADAKNVNYITGAIWYAFREFERKKYIVLHDSMKLKSRLDKKISASATSVRYFNSGDFLRGRSSPDGEGEEFGWDNPFSRFWSLQQLEAHTSYTIPEVYPGLFGSALICDRSVLEKLHGTGFSKILPTTKIEDQSMERLWGIALYHEGYDIKTNTVAGDHCNGPSQEIVEKTFFAGTR